jgi:hypothetical protein
MLQKSERGWECEQSDSKHDKHKDECRMWKGITATGTTHRRTIP